LRYRRRTARIVRLDVLEGCSIEESIMKKFLIAGAAVLGLAGAAAPALAQDTPEQITVVPPFTQHENQTPLIGGMKTQTISFNRYVGYGDLDLSKPSGRTELADRIEDAARNACNELDAKYPPAIFVPTPADQDCFRNATRGALAMANISDDSGVPE
jgi:UrcA family protein